jgi:hypothetical protein
LTFIVPLKCIKIYLEWIRYVSGVINFVSKAQRY